MPSNNKKSAKNRGRKDDLGKPDHTMYPLDALNEVAYVFEYGANKYGRLNFNRVKDGRHRYLKALLRHSLAEASGESIDDESGFHHLAHAICSGLIALHFALQEENKK